MTDDSDLPVSDSDPPSFEIPVRPRRRFRRNGGVEYEGRTVFELHPEPSLSRSVLERHLQAVLDAERYVYGDRGGLPAPVYLVHDRARRTVFRVVVRDDRLELHALPNSDAETFREVYDRLERRDGVAWSVECRTSGDDRPGDG